jgi:uncharacterized delta-60 repeat protein
MRSRLGALFFLLLATLAPGTAHAALSPGQLDSAFGSGGLLDFEPSLAAPKFSFVNDIALDAQGRILVTGAASDSTGNQAIMVARFAQGGQPDTTFGDNGVFVKQISTATTPNTPNSSGQFVAPGPDGTVMVGALTYSPGPDFVAMRLNSSGRVDINYGGNGNGVATISHPSVTFYSAARSGVVNPDGSMVLIGQYTNDGDHITGLAPMLFPANGVGGSYRGQQLGQTADGSNAQTIVQLPSGKYIVGGQASRTSGGNQSYIARLGADNPVFDTSYGSTGTGAVFNQLGSGTTPSSTTKALANGPDGSLYAVADASVDDNGRNRVAVTRYGVNGQLDPGFGPGATRYLSLDQCTGSGTCGTDGWDVLVDSQGRALVLVRVTNGDSSRRFALARYLPDGTLDASFGTDGISYGPLERTTNFISMVFGADNRMFLGGSNSTGSGSYHALLGRLALERVEDPPPPASGGGSTPPAGNPPVVDKTPPKLTKLKIAASTKTRKATLALTSSEAGKLAIKITRARTAHRKTSKSKCSTTVKTGRRCTLYVSYRSLTATLLSGKHSIALGRSAFALGSYRAVVTATDKSGNKAKAITVSFVVKAAPKPKKKS